MIGCSPTHERSVRRQGDNVHSYCLSCNRERNLAYYRKPPDMERFWLFAVQGDGCWPWIGAVDGDGYGRFAMRSAYRIAYEAVRGPVPVGLTLDHLCRNRECVNPDHLEPVTNRENILRGESPAAKHARQSHCLNGHSFDSANTYRWHGQRICRACNRERSSRRAE